MTMSIKTITAVAAGTMLATSAFAQSAKEVRGASPYAAIENEPAPKLIVDPPLPRERAHRAGVRDRRPQRIATGGAFAHTRRRCALVVGGRERHQYNRHCRGPTRPAQDSDRLGQSQPSALSRIRHVQAAGDVQTALLG